MCLDMNPATNHVARQTVQAAFMVWADGQGQACWQRTCSNLMKPCEVARYNLTIIGHQRYHDPKSMVCGKAAVSKTLEPEALMPQHETDVASVKKHVASNGLEFQYIIRLTWDMAQSISSIYQGQRHGSL